LHRISSPWAAIIPLIATAIQFPRFVLKPLAFRDRHGDRIIA